MDEQLEVILRGRKFKKTMTCLFEELRRKYDLKHIDIEVLFYLRHNPNATASEICRNTNLNKGQVSLALDSLCKNGYLSPKTDHKDRRYISYEETEKCVPFFDEGFRIRNLIWTQLFAGVTEEEVEVMRKVSEKISKNIDQLHIT